MPAAAERSAQGGLDRPRFRQDLVAEAIEEQGGRFIDVMAPETGSLYRFYEVEYALACGMDGERDVAGIVKWAHDELGLAATATEVRSVIATLGGLGFIGDDAAEAEPELAAGVIAAPVAAEPPVEDVALGAAGASAPARREPVAAPPNLALGAAGASAPGKKPSAPAEDVALGAPGRSVKATPPPPVADDVSLDLADHMAVRRDDVKEAVRASKVMSAVDVPKELLDALEDRPTPKPEPVRPEPVAPKRPSEPPAPMRVEARPAAPVREPAAPVRAPEPKAAESARMDRVEKPAEPRVEAKPVEAPAVITDKPVARPVAKPAVELPKAPPPATTAEKVAVPPAPRSGVSPALIVILILAVLAGAGFFVWKYVLDKPAASDETAVQTAPAKPEVAPPAPPPVVAPTAKIAMETPAAEEIKLATAGVVETILADKTVVKPGDVLVKLVGDKPVEAELAALNKELATLGTKLEAAQKKLAAADAQPAKDRATAEIAALEKTQGTKRDALGAKTTELDKFQIHAKTGGTFSPVAKQGAKVAADGIVGHLQGDATPAATFKVSDPKPYTVGGTIEITAGAQTVACTVAEVQVDGVKVTCPADAALTDGADVTLKLPGAAPAAGSAAPAAGSAAPAAGSAEAPMPAAGSAGAGSAEAPAPTAGSAEAPAGSAAPAK
jgi:hypothetical protein